MTTEHFRLLCSDMRTLHVFFQVAEKFARGEIPESVVKMGRMAALSKLDGGARNRRFLFAYLDDTFIVTQPGSTGDSFRSMETELWKRAKIRIHGGKTKIWHRAGIRPPDEFERRARAVDPSAPRCHARSEGSRHSIGSS